VVLFGTAPRSAFCKDLKFINWPFVVMWRDVTVACSLFFNNLLSFLDKMRLPIPQSLWAQISSLPGSAQFGILARVQSGHLRIPWSWFIKGQSCLQASKHLVNQLDTHNTHKHTHTYTCTHTCTHTHLTSGMKRSAPYGAPFSVGRAIWPGKPESVTQAYMCMFV